MRVLSQLSEITGGTVYQRHARIFILAQGDELKLPGFDVVYPLTDGPSNAYILNGSHIFCNGKSEENTWTVPSDISNSFFAKNSLNVQTDGTFLYLQVEYSSPFEDSLVA
ncbi:MAG: hypothetical protein FJ161_01435 [Gammaproteobacteria bacterium]|nr:hypothetical protein [Gammaproteobacteria bacterium]